MCVCVCVKTVQAATACARMEWQKVFPGFEPCAVLNEFFSHFVGGPTEVQTSDSRVCAVTTEVWIKAPVLTGSSHARTHYHQLSGL